MYRSRCADGPMPNDENRVVIRPTVTSKPITPSDGLGLKPLACLYLFSATPSSDPRWMPNRSFHVDSVPALYFPLVPVVPALIEMLRTFPFVKPTLAFSA